MLNYKISVIIPFYKNVIWLEEAVESVLNQTYSNIEIIIINDGSIEDISNFLEKYYKKIIYIKQENYGAAAARNIGIEASNGEYIAFLDSDDLWKPEKLQKQLQKMIEMDAVWSHTNYERFGTKLEKEKVNMDRFKGCVFPACLLSNPIATPCVMIRAKELKNHMEFRFQEELKSGEDTFLWMLLSQKYELVHLCDYLTMVRIKGDNSALLAYSQIRARAEIWIKIKDLEFIKSNSSITRNTRLAYQLCIYQRKLLKLIKCEELKEFFSKILYLFPWLLFKNEMKKFHK